MKHLSTTTVNQIKTAVFFACSVPLAQLLLDFFTDTFGPDPVADITHTTGIWALNLLLVSLAITPLRKLTHWNWLVRLRRTISVYAFFYAFLHTLTYLVFDQFFDWLEIARDLTRRPFMTAGLVSFVLMIPLVATSTTAMMKRMGGRYWQMLHRLAYPVATAGVLHYFWLVKRDVTEPSIYAMILLVLFCLRLTKPRPVAQDTAKIKNLARIKSV